MQDRHRVELVLGERDHMRVRIEQRQSHQATPPCDCGQPPRTDAALGKVVYEPLPGGGVLVRKRPTDESLFLGERADEHT